MVLLSLKSQIQITSAIGKYCPFSHSSCAMIGLTVTVNWGRIMRIFSRSTPYSSMFYPVSQLTGRQNSSHWGGMVSTTLRSTRFLRRSPYGQQATRSLRQKTSEELTTTFAASYFVHLCMIGMTFCKFCASFPWTPRGPTMRLQRPPEHPNPQDCFQSRWLPLLSLEGETTNVQDLKRGFLHGEILVHIHDSPWPPHLILTSISQTMLSVSIGPAVARTHEGSGAGGYANKFNMRSITVPTIAFVAAIVSPFAFTYLRHDHRLILPHRPARMH